MLDNLKLSNVPNAVEDSTGKVLLAGSSGSATIRQWAMGNVYTGTSGSPTYVTATQNPGTKPSNLLDASGRIFGRGRPQYANYAASQIVSVKSNGAKGDGQTDDTADLQAILNKVSGLADPCL